MSEHPTDFQGSVEQALASAIEAKIPDAVVTVTGGGGHYSLSVTAEAFRSLTMLQSHRLVYGAVAHLMAGSAPPVHAIDSLQTRAP